MTEIQLIDIESSGVKWGRYYTHKESIILLIIFSNDPKRNSNIFLTKKI